MRVAKPTKAMLDAANDFKNACEAFFEREKYSFKDPQDRWEGWDDDDDDKQDVIKIKKNLAEEIGCREKDVDNRIVAYEYLRSKYTNRLGHVIMTAGVLLDNCCDPTKDYLDFAPGHMELHVAPEQ